MWVNRPSNAGCLRSAACQPFLTLLLRYGALLSLTMPMAWAEGMDGRVTFSWQPEQPRPGEPFSLTVQGQWANSCVPEIQRSEVEDDTIVLWAERRTKDCVRGDTDYRFDIDPTAEAKTDTLQAGVYQLKLFVVDQGAYLGRLQGFDLLEISQARSTIKPETGLWWPRTEGRFSTSGPGTGFSLESQGDAVVLMANVYDNERGHPTWLFATGTLKGHVVRAQMVTLWGGQSLFGEYQAPEQVLPAADLLLHFDSQATATAWFTTPMGVNAERQLVLRPLSLVRWTFGRRGASSAAGRWILVEEDSENASVRRYDFLTPLGEDMPLVRLYDRTSGAYLECQTPVENDNALPAMCRLFSAQGRIEAIFDDIGLDRMRGVLTQGRGVTAFRLNP